MDFTLMYKDDSKVYRMQICKDVETGQYRFVNLDKCQISKGYFNSLYEAAEDMLNYDLITFVVYNGIWKTPTEFLKQLKEK